MATATNATTTPTLEGAADTYVVWHSPAGHHGLHGPYPHRIAQQLVKHAPGQASVVVATVGATDHYRFIEVLALYLATSGSPERRATALLATGITHVGTKSDTAIVVALAHVLNQLAADTDAAAIADALVDAGFAPAR